MVLEVSFIKRWKSQTVPINFHLEIEREKELVSHHIKETDLTWTKEVEQTFDYICRMHSGLKHPKIDVLFEIELKGFRAFFAYQKMGCFALILF